MADRALLDQYHFLLASKSPRRRKLFQEFGASFSIVEVEYDEVVFENENPVDVPVRLAEGKGSQYTEPIGDSQVLVTADTVVSHNNQVLGKPSDKKEAREMLESLSGSVHEVISGVTLRTADKTHSFNEITRVEFWPLSRQDIEHYIEHHDALDKAGAYGIQDWIGIVGVKNIQGCYYNVVGFPFSRFIYELKNLSA